ncbi:DNA-directed RNA polymerase subunit alpha C-terminal domain-containing protein [Caballeronia sp. LP003]|uniref:DNA-directed RNA polymerase subunit alpha C-terminal domain-containing protein n=1 Tax=Caballeronia sp. LP003 TaxID=3038551 RepID=UPI002860D0C8|nr:DNA-directed RNA polymerase subunit alpha C-terminal domain-containing protein [Caballeronia sp. LP003]MDR5790312.1 DNA-directed RNA polymerase subunit alpha C-terminal domain-containing protein [Caballeronia sp. LP003]
MRKHVCTALDRAGLRAVDQIIKRSAGSLLHLHGLGSKSLLELETALARFGLALAKERSDEQD